MFRLFSSNYYGCLKGDILRLSTSIKKKILTLNSNQTYWNLFRKLWDHKRIFQIELIDNWFPGNENLLDTYFKAIQKVLQWVFLYQNQSWFICYYPYNASVFYSRDSYKIIYLIMQIGLIYSRYSSFGTYSLMYSR